MPKRDRVTRPQTAAAAAANFNGRAAAAAATEDIEDDDGGNNRPSRKSFAQTWFTINKEELVVAGVHRTETQKSQRFYFAIFFGVAASVTVAVLGT